MKNQITQNRYDKDFDIVQVFCVFDDIVKTFLSGNRNNKGGRPSSLSATEVAVITLIQKEFNIGNKKALFKHLLKYHSNDFNLPSYKSFCDSLNRYSKTLLEIIIILVNLNKNKSGRILFIDSTKLEVCKIWRASEHKTMKQLANKSKSTTGWFYGLKLHIVCDELGNLVEISFTSGNVDDRIFLKQFLDKIENKIIGADAGYVSKECQEKAKENNNILLTAIRSNMKGLGVKWQQKVLNMRSTVERCFSVMKTRLNLISTLPRSINGYLSHYIRVLFMYVFKDWLKLKV